MTTLESLNVALIGCGAVSKLYYTPALQKLEREGQVRLRALFDPSTENLSQIRQAFPGAAEARALEDLANLDLDLAIVASPPQYHAVQTIQLLQSGLHVLCEKPMALSIAEGESMAAVAAEAGRFLAVGLVRRFFPVTQTIHHLLSRKMLGDVLSFTCFEGREFRWPVQSANYFHQNGVLRDTGVHVLDLLTWWWGEPEEIVYEDDAMGGVEVNCRIRLRFPQGFTGEVRLSREFQLPNYYSIECEHGTIRWDIDETTRLRLELPSTAYYLHSELRRWNPNDGRTMAPGRPAEEFDECFVNQLKNVIAAVRGRGALVVPAEEGLRSLRALETCYARRSLMDMPWLAGPESEPVRQLQGEETLR